MSYKKPTKTALYLQDVAELVKDTYPLNISKLSSLLDQYTAIKQKHSSRVTSRMPQLFIRMLLEWHMYHYADNVPVDKSQLVYISRFMDYKRRIVEMLIDTGKIHIVTPFVGYDFYIINHLREKWEEAHPELNRQNRILYTAVKAYKVGVDIPVTDVDAELPLLEKVAVDNGKLEDVYGVYDNGCIGINKRENCNMLQKSLVKVARGDRKSLEKVEEVRKWSKKQLLKKSIQLLSAVKHFPDAQWCINVQCVNQDL